MSYRLHSYRSFSPSADQDDNGLGYDNYHKPRCPLSLSLSVSDSLCLSVYLSLSLMQFRQFLLESTRLSYSQLDFLMHFSLATLIKLNFTMLSYTLAT